MKNILAILFFGLVIVGAFIAYKTPFSFCDIPLTYKIGSIDTRFGLKQKDALSDISDAVNIFASASGKKLFDYSQASGVVTIDFVYDQRSALDSDINTQQSQISKADSSLQKKIKTYETDIKLFEEKILNLNATIQKYNNSGGAPPDIYNGIINEQNQLKIDGEVLNARAKQLNLETHNFNSSVQILNQNVSTFNQALEQKPEEGLYDGTKKTITIFFVNSKNELIHTLTHEFGHSMGMDHVDNPKAIMYPKTSNYLKFTEDDRSELNKVCKSFPLPEYWIYQFRQELSKFIENSSFYFMNKYE